MISVIICTYNRAESLRQALRDLASVRPPAEDDVEIVVIDNNSTDGTATVLQELRCGCGPHAFRCILETTQGKTHALNRGIREAKGDWLVFTDDDVRIEPEWLESLHRAIVESGCLAIGGQVIPIWPSNVPSWVATEGPYVQNGIFVHYSPRETAGVLDPSDAEPVGCNFAFHQRVFHDFGPFRTDLGHIGRKIMGGEDTELCERLRAGGMPIWYASDAVVRHPVGPERLRLGYLARWKFWAGYGLGQSGERRSGRGLAGVPFYLFRRLAAHAWAPPVSL